MAEADAQIYQLRAVIRGISPMIWRRLLVRADSTVAQLHEVLQITFGWNDEHLNRFEIRGREYAVYREGGGLIGIDARRVRLSDLKLRRLERFVYEYDFGDSWVHDLRLEATRAINPRTLYPTCVAGKCAAPPEDCGGSHAFMAQRGRFAARVRRQSVDELDDFEAELDDEDFDSVDDYDPDRFGVPSRKGILRTIAAMHHQRNQRVMSTSDRNFPPQEFESGDTITIKYLAAPGVRNAPNLEAIPRRHGSRYRKPP
jgi:Plasmid pRiA4b ORF-3-like protein